MVSPRDELQIAGDAPDGAPVKVRVRSALNPLLWACGVVTVPLYGLAPMKSGVLQYMMLGVGALPVVGLLTAYGYFALRHPDRLRSEVHQLPSATLPHAAPADTPAALGVGSADQGEVRAPVVSPVKR